MSEPTEAGDVEETIAKELTTLFYGDAAMWGRLIGTMCDPWLLCAAYVQELRAEGHAAGRREMREEAARTSLARGFGIFDPSLQSQIAKAIRALPDHPETKGEGQ